ncbi:MAG: NTP transferase domain-containing protein [Succinivibrio sp.]|nr:NTP transferase domain-containing protein [Succinivibrio sp.]
MKSVNAIILAAGGATDKISNDFDIPKPLYKVNGESLIERLIKQLHEKNIVDITVVVGSKRNNCYTLKISTKLT